MPRFHGLQWTAENLDTIPKIGVLRPGETEDAIVSFQARMTGMEEQFTGTPVVETSVDSGEEDQSGEISVSSPVITTDYVEGRLVTAGHAVAFTISLTADAEVGTIFRIKVTAATNGDPARTLIEEMLLRVI